MLRAGEDQMLGRFDMVEQDPYVSRAQCTVQVSPSSGAATLTSLGKAPTNVRTHAGAPWYGLRKGEEHVLADGDQFCLADVSASSRRKEAIFTCEWCQQRESDAGAGTAAGEWIAVQYSEDGQWMWDADGGEWVPAAYQGG